MSEGTSFEPTMRSDGTLDPDCLEHAGEHWVKEWLRRRLSGSDRWFPIDPRYGEDPESFVVGIVEDAGLDHPATARIGRSALRLLDNARALAPDLPPYITALLRLCQQVKLPWTGDWFTEEIRALTKAKSSLLVEQRWGPDLIREILYAAVLQAPALPGTAASAIWLELSREPRYATLALLSFGSSIEARASHLAEWWQAVTFEERSRELRQIVSQGLKNQGDERLRTALSKAGEYWGNNLQREVNAALRQQGIEEVFRVNPEVSRRSTRPAKDSPTGLVNFYKNIGRKIGSMTLPQQQPKEDDERRMSADIVKLVDAMGFMVDDLAIRVKGDNVIVAGIADNQEIREKLVLLVGNIEGISGVDDRLQVRRAGPEATFYEVKPGDTLSKIAKQHYGDANKYNLIFEANRPMLKDPDEIYPGLLLRIPAVAASHTARHPI